jgi:hypothetical protein
VTTPGGTATSTTNFTIRTTHTRSVSLELNGHLTARGVLTAADGFTSCEASVTIKIQKRRRGGGWRTIRTTTTDAGGGYQVSLPDSPGSYRAVAMRGGTDSDVCPRTKSSPRRHRH